VVHLDGKPTGVVHAKRKGVTLAGVAIQSDQAPIRCSSKVLKTAEPA
jgi:hypothetical protein